MIKPQDRYEHRESRAPVIVIGVIKDNTGFGYDVVSFRFVSDIYHGFIHSLNVNDFIKNYKPGIGN